MRTIILLTILAVLPISCRFYLNRKLVGDDEAYQAAKKIVHTLNIALHTINVDLYLSLFDKNVIIQDCGGTITYADLEAIVTYRDPRDPPLSKYEFVNAVIEGDYLKFEITRAGFKSLVTAVRNGAEFKIIAGKTENCRRRLHLQQDVGEYIY